MRVNCLTCGVEFNRKASHVAKSKEQFCSVQCRSNTAARFWRFVEKTDSCWLWIGPVLVSGYGKFRPDRGTVIAHRYSWELHNGPIPKGLLVCHDCPIKDNPLCVNPAHLWLGSHLENVVDGLAKDQFIKGEEVHTAKLSEEDVRLVRKLAQHGALFVNIAGSFGVTGGTISDAVKMKTWKHVS